MDKEQELQDVSSQNTPMQKKQKWPKGERLADMKRLGEEIGFWNLNQGELAKKYGVDRRTVYVDLELLYKQGIDIEAVTKTKVNIYHMNKRMMRSLHSDFVRATKISDKTMIADSMCKLQDHMTRFLERFGVKQIYDQPEISITQINQDKAINVIQERVDQLPLHVRKMLLEKKEEEMEKSTTD